MITPPKVVESKILASAEARKKVLINTLCYVGEQCIKEARDNGGYNDQTGNLRSSIGYVVLCDGQVVDQKQVKKQKKGNEGISEGAKFLLECAEKAQKKGIVLIVVAGMNYAEYVETRYNVLSSAELKAGPLVQRLLKRLGFKVK